MGRGAASQLLSRGRLEQLRSGVGHAGDDEQLALAAGWNSHRRRAGHTSQYGAGWSTHLSVVWGVG